MDDFYTVFSRFFTALNTQPYLLVTDQVDHQTFKSINLSIVFALRCAGLSDVDMKFGPCWNDNPCSGDHNCKSGEKCIPARQVCLTMLKRSCVQYKCSKCRFIGCQRSINDKTGNYLEILLARIKIINHLIILCRLLKRTAVWTKFV